MHDNVKEYYGKLLQSSKDLKTNACCTDISMPGYLKDALSNIHEEVLQKYYGCGLVLPELIDGAKILDLGSGSGRDCYVLAQLAGEQGEVVGIDMTAEQLEVAERHIDYHRQKFSYRKSNVSFHMGYIEHLDELDLPANSFDLIVSNCVINLSPDKEAVLQQAYRLLKPGGELYFSDVYADRRVPQELIEDPELFGECLSGALYWKDFERLACKAGFIDPRLVSDKPITIANESIIEKIGHIGFYSATYRLFKLPELESACEDYGQAVLYRGGIPYHEQVFNLDKHHRIQRGKVFPVCGNTYRMLQQTRFQTYFDFIGDWQCHYGIFQGCGSDLPYDQESVAGSASSSCC